jgi:WD40 repeat protein
MKKLWKLLKSGLGLGLLLALVLVLAWLFGAQKETRQVAEPEPKATAMAPTAIATVEEVPTSTATPKPPPGLEDYDFSEPQVVLTHTSAIGIAGWLPDSERLLITRRIPGEAREYIETFNVRTGELKRYAERKSLDSKPVWLEAQEAVAFVDAKRGEGKSLRISKGEGQPIMTVATGMASRFISADPQGKSVIFQLEGEEGRPAVFDVESSQARELGFELPLLSIEEMAALGQMGMPEPYRAAWHPDGSRVAFYNDTGFYLADLSTGQVQKVNLGRIIEGEVETWPRWALHAQWSPDGRYLAMLTTVGDLPLRFSDLTIFDTITGELRSMHPEQYVEPGRYYVTNIAWAPNSRHLAILAVVRKDDAGFDHDGLFIVDSVARKIKRFLPDYEFGGGGWGWEMAWSSDGRQLVINCPTRSEGRLCMISVSVH